MQTIQTTISAVQVYRRGAEITRKGIAVLEQGSNTIRILGLTGGSDMDTAKLFFPAGTALSGQSMSDSVLIVAGKNWEKWSLSDDQEQITLQPGILGGRVNQILKPYGRVFPPDPASINSAMVGGIVGNNAADFVCGG